MTPNGNGFIKGLRLYDWDSIDYTPYYWGNSSHCFNNMTKVTWELIPKVTKYLMADNPGVWEKWQIIASGLQVWAYGLWTCNSMLKNFHNYAKLRIELFGTWLNFTYGFL